jgi:energy-coupling factor transport system permease protein
MFIIGSLTIATRESILQFSKFASRFIAITYLCILFFWTTTMATILATLRWFGLPYRQSLVITLAFRFVPFIAEAFKMISDSHAMRESTYGQKVHKRNRIKDIMPTVTAALVFSLKSIPNLAMSLEHRGFGRSNVRTTFRSLETNRSLFTHCALSVIICVLFWILFHS